MADVEAEDRENLKAENAAFARRMGSQFKMLREGKNWSQEALSEKSGVARNYVGQVERGERSVTIFTARRILRALGVTLSKFLSDMTE